MVAAGVKGVEGAALEVVEGKAAEQQEAPIIRDREGAAGQVVAINPQEALSQPWQVTD
jgi:hypothetical protein